MTAITTGSFPDLTIRAAVLSQLGAPLEIVDQITIPELRAGQVLVKIAYTGVCHSQVMEARGSRGEDNWLPHMLGHEATGRVVATGEGVAKVAVDDLVVLGWIKGSGVECGGSQYGCDGRLINSGAITTFSDHAVISENRLVKLPDGVPLDVGVLFGCALPTGAGIVLNELDPRPNSTIAIFGIGGIGVCALLAAVTHDFAKVIAVDVSPDKLALAQQIGADAIIDARQTDPVDAIRSMTDGGADYAVDASGQTKVIEQAFAATNPSHGLTVFASHPKAGQKITLDPHELIAGRQIRGSWGGASDPDVDVPKFAALYRAGKLPLEKLLTDRYRLDQINQALDDLEAGRVMRPLIEVDANV